MSNISVDYDVLNQRGSPAWFSDVYANIPTAGYKGRMFISIDTYAFYRDTGTGWDLIGGPGTGTITGSGATGQVSFFNGSSTLAGSNNLFWDNTNSRLGIGTTTPGAPLDIHATGTNAQFNGTGSNNAYLVFQNAGTSKWRIGNTFSSPNSFDIYNNATTTNALSISSSNILSFIGVSNFDEVIRLKQNLLSYATSSGYTTMFSTTGGGLYTLGFYNGGGALSQISFTTAASYSYVFPSASGTLALTSNLSSYVPYTGATTSVDLGTNSITAIQLIASASGGNAPGYLLYYNSTLYASISSTATYFQFNSNTSAGYLFKNSSGTDIFRITNSGQIGNGINTYTLPSSNGTLALTSDLSSYLPLTGGTLTGQLYINPTNTAITGLDVASNTTIIRSDNLEGFKRQLEITMSSGTLVQLTAKGYGANYGTDLAFYTATSGGTNTSPAIYITGTNNRVGIKTGTPDSDLQVAGTCKIDSTFTSVAEIVLGSSGSYPVGGTGFRNDGTNLNIYYGSTACYFKDSTNVERVRITAAGNVGIDTDPGAVRLYVKSLTTTSSSIGFAVHNGATNLFIIRGDGAVFLQPSYPFTTGSAPNLFVDASGVIQKFVSSIKYKTDVIDYNNGLDKVLKLRPVSYKSKNSITDGNKTFAGFIAEEVHELGLNEFVVYDKDGSPDAISYSNMIALLTKAIQELNDKLIKNNIN